MNKLIITAHPNPKGFTHKIANEYKKHSEDRHEVKVIDLYNKKRKQDYLFMDIKNRTSDDELRPLMQELITWADELVFIFPLWWFDAPAVMKNWFDVNMSHGFAFKYTGGVIPERLLKGKKSRIFLTSGGPTWITRTLGIGTYINWKMARLRYVGITLASYTVFGSMNKLRYPEDRKKMLKKVANIAKRS